MDELVQKKQVMEEIINEHNHISFEKKYGITVDEAYEQYSSEVEKCCGCGGKGYTVWIPEIAEKYSSNHYVVFPKLYSQCQPTQRDRDAYKIKHGEEMVIPTETHVEIWGN